jgi:hypothetical protein
MDKIKELSIQLLNASNDKDIDKCLKLLEEIIKIIETYKRSC